MSGWKRLGCVALAAWWVVCGIYVYAGYRRSSQISEATGLDEETATELMLGRGSLGLDPDLGRHFLEAHDRIYTGSYGAVVVPVVAFFLIFVGRWVAAGFSHGSR